MRHFFCTIALLICALLPMHRVKAEPAAKESPAVRPFALTVWPQSISVLSRHPIYLCVALENRTDQDRSIRFWFTPVPFGSKTDLHCLLIHCYNRKTRKDAHYTGIPPGKTLDDARGKESTCKVYAQSFTGYTVNMTQFCDLPPGDYSLVMQYDTSYVPQWMQPDKRAWHEKTNKVLVNIHIRRATSWRKALSQETRIF